MNNFQQKEALKEAICLFLVRGYGAGNILYYSYIAVAGVRLADFKKALDDKSKPLDLNSWGKIIAWGEGNPPEDVQYKMQDEYGFNHANMIDLT